MLINDPGSATSFRTEVQQVCIHRRCVLYRIKVSSMAAPNTGQRQECYMARDTFYQCMVKNNENTEACKNEEKLYHSKCLTSWVSACMVLAAH